MPSATFDAGGTIIAGPRGADGALVDTEAAILSGSLWGGFRGGEHTTLSVVMLNAALTKSELQQLARASTAAYHRRLGPAGTSFDGDVIFAVSPMDGRRVPLIQAEAAATAAIEQAIVRAVRSARGRDGIPGLAD